MRQRLVFAAALLHDPPVLVIDEPMVGLDPRSVRVVKDLLRERAAAGTTVFMSTHTLAVAEEIADRIGIMDRGRLHFLGTVGELQRELASHQTSLEPLFLELTKRQRHGGKGDGRATTNGARKGVCRMAAEKNIVSTAAISLPSFHAIPLPSPPAISCPPTAEARAFWRMRRRIVATLLRQTFAHGALPAGADRGVDSLLWGGMFWLFADGFQFLQHGDRSPRNLRARRSADVRHVLRRADADAGVFLGRHPLRLAVSLAGDGLPVDRFPRGPSGCSCTSFRRRSC